MLFLSLIDSRVMEVLNKCELTVVASSFICFHDWVSVYCATVR